VIVRLGIVAALDQGQPRARWSLSPKVILLKLKLTLLKMGGHRAEPRERIWRKRRDVERAELRVRLTGGGHGGPPFSAKPSGATLTDADPRARGK
jgi:hypothetical protein